MVFGLQRAKSTTEQGIQQRSTGEQCVPSEVEALPTQRKLILPSGRSAFHITSFVLLEYRVYIYIYIIYIHIYEYIFGDNCRSRRVSKTAYHCQYARFSVLSNVQLSNFVFWLFEPSLGTSLVSQLHLLSLQPTLSLFPF